MAAQERQVDRGRRQVRRQLSQLGDELREARLAAGQSQAHVGRVAGIDQARISRTERSLRSLTGLDQLAAHAAALGLTLSLKLYPAGSPVRDAGQLRLLERFRTRVGPGLTWRTEVPISGADDLRAWDVRLDGNGSIGVEAETRLYDIQATQRRIELKARDSGVTRTLLVVARTRHNRRVLSLHREALRSTLPGDTTEVLAALRRGHVPTRNGIVIV